MVALPSTSVVVLGSLAVAGAGLSALAVYALMGWDGPGARSFASFAGVLGVGALALVAVGATWGIHPPSQGETGASLWFQLLNVLLVVETVPWVGFALWYTGQSERLGIDRRRFAVVVLPVVVTTAVWVVPTVTAGAGIGQWWVVRSFVGVAVVFGFFYWIALHFAGVIAVLRTVHVYGHLRTAQGAFVTVAGVAPLLLYWMAWGLDLPGTTDAGTIASGAAAAGFLVAAGSLGVALLRYDVLESTPAPGNVGRTALLEEIDDLVFVTDDEGHVVESNRTATEELGVERSDLLGRRLTDVVGVTVADAEAVDSVRMNTVEGHREFDAEVSTLTDQREVPIGTVVTMHDVTDRTIRRQRIEVLNRVLRHNLRNKMAIVKGTAAYVSDGEFPPDRLAESLGTAADEMVELGEKAREIEQVIQEREHMATEVDLDRTVRRIAEETREAYPGVTVRVAVPDGLTVHTDRNLLSYAVENLVENAAKHNDAGNPTVEVRVETGEGYPIRITVTDNGPGIPDHERAVIAEGEETPLEHGIGLGLWATSWCIARLGGELSFGEPDGRGSRVRIELPAAPEMAAPLDRAGGRASVPDD